MNTTEIFKEILKKSDKSQVEIAEKIGTTKQHVNSWKSGRKGVSLNKLHSIANALGLKILVSVTKKHERI